MLGLAICYLKNLVLFNLSIEPHFVLIIRTKGRGMVATENGRCECGADTVEIGNKCVDNTILAISGSLAGVILLAILGYFYISYRNRKNDQIWQVDLDELHFDDPVEVIGQGSFGVVLLAVSLIILPLSGMFGSRRRSFPYFRFCIKFIGVPRNQSSHQACR